METREEHLAWLQKILPGLLTSLRRWCQSSTALTRALADELGNLLDVLAVEAALEVYRASTQDEVARFLAIIIPLWVLASAPDIWIDLLTRCCRNQQAQDFIKNHWEVHKKLLEAAIQVIGPDNTIASFLLDVQPVRFGELLAFLQHNAHMTAQLVAWSHTATQYWLPKIRTSNGALWNEGEMVRELTKHFAQVKVLVAQLLKSPLGQRTQLHYAQRRKTAWSLFITLADSVYRDQQKMELLEIWFIDAEKGEELPDIPFEDIQLNDAQKEWVLGKIWPGSP